MDKATQAVSLIVVAWRRGSARLVDFVLGYTLWLVPTGCVAYQYFMPVNALTFNRYYLIWMSILLLGIPVAFIVEGLWYRMWGPTPGKRLFALKVVDIKGMQLSAADYNARLLRLYCQGVLCGIPVLSQLGKCIQAACLINRGSTTYDDGRYQVLITTPTVAQVVVWVILFTGVPALIQSLNVMAVLAGY